MTVEGSEANILAVGSSSFRKSGFRSGFWTLTGHSPVARYPERIFLGIRASIRAWQ